jgi:transketolase
MTSIEFAKDIRKTILQLVFKAKASHVGGALSMTDLLAVLYNGVMNVKPENPEWEERDIFLLSKGHACTGVYATLALKNFFSLDELFTYSQNGSRLLSHTSHKVPGVELSTGSLGHAFSVGCGLALSFKRKKNNRKVFVMLSDGELDEGSNWEAILFAPHHRLNNIVAIVDYNKIQSFGTTAEVLNLEPLAKKFDAFGWNAIEVDGHNHEEIKLALDKAAASEKPAVIIAHTVKGKGVDFMENELLWHYKSPTEEQLNEALKQIEA